MANIVIDAVGTQWRAGGVAASPLIVTVQPGDTIEIKVQNNQHGFVTIDKPGDQSPAADVKYVVACGEDILKKPAAVLQEIECSRLGKTLSASMKMRVLDSFNADVHFWCTVHEDMMWGTFKKA
jgi:hypothetical protein